MHHAMALAAARLERRPVEDDNLSAGVADQAGRLQLAGGVGDRLATQAEQAGDALLGHGDPVVRAPIQAEQQPAAELLFDAVVPGAEQGLCRLDHQGLGVTQRHLLQAPARGQFPAQGFGFQEIGVAASLHDQFVAGQFVAENCGDAGQPIVADHRQFRGSAIAGGGDQRNDATGREIDLA